MYLAEITLLIALKKKLFAHTGNGNFKKTLLFYCTIAQDEYINPDNPTK